MKDPGVAFFFFYSRRGPTLHRRVLWVQLCPQKKACRNSNPGLQNMTLFEDRVFTEVIN